MDRFATILMLLLAILVSSASQAASFTISASANKGGTISPSGKTSVASGGSQTYTMTASSGYYLADVKVDGASQGTTNPYTLENVSADHKIAAKFAANPVIIAKANRGGTVTPKGKVSVNYNGSQSFTISPNTGYHLVDVKVDGTSQGAISSHTFSSVTAKHTLVAKFAINTYTLTTSAGQNGKISPANATVKYGASKVITIRPNKGYQIASVTVNGEAQSNIPSTGAYKLTLSSISQNMTIAATFSAITVEGLAIGSQVSVVDAQESSGNATLGGLIQQLGALADTQAIPANSDYNEDKTNVYVNEKAGEAFDTVNMILCMVDQTKYSDSKFLNQGFYKAMVDPDVCEGNDSAENSGESTQAGTSGSEAPSYDLWTVKSERASETSKEIVTAYVHLSEGGPGEEPMTIQAKMVISEAKSETNPLGIFTMNFLGFRDSMPNVPVMKGILKTVWENGNVLIKFAEQEGPDINPMHVAKAAYIRNDASQTGQGSAYQKDSFGETPHEVSFDFAYDATFFKRVNSANNENFCLDRTRFETSAWRYGLYDANSGSRMNLNGGFPINTQENGSGFYGYLGYYGLHLPPEAPALTDGSTVYKKVWENGSQSTTPYTLVVKGGKLKKHVKSVITLDDIKNIPLEGSIPAPGGSGPGNTMYRVSWDGSSLAIRAQATMGENGPPAWTELDPPTIIDANYLLPFSNIGLYSQALGGQLTIQLDNCTTLMPNNPGSGFKCNAPNGNTQVVFYKESTVTPNNTVPANLVCYDNCPKAASSAGMDGTSQETMTYPMYFGPGADNRHDYTFNDMLLHDSGTAFDVVLASAPAGQPWGFNSGPLFEPNQQNLATLACDWNPNETCGWKAWNALGEFYTWETGPNSWNRYTAVKDGNDNFVTFDPPMQVAFTYPVAGTDGVNPDTTDSKYGGTKFFLQYSGFGDLHGIPGKCVDPADPSQAVTDCSRPGLRWVPEFTIPAGSLVTAGNGSYLVKPLDIEQRMSKALGSCDSLVTADMSSSWPDVKNDWVNPSLPDEPQIQEPPKVIGGVIQ